MGSHSRPRGTKVVEINTIQRLHRAARDDVPKRRSIPVTPRSTPRPDPLMSPPTRPESEGRSDWGWGAHGGTAALAEVARLNRRDEPPTDRTVRGERSATESCVDMHAQPDRYGWQLAGDLAILVTAEAAVHGQFEQPRVWKVEGSWTHRGQRPDA